jgi:DNA polymerase II large subunit
VSHHDAWAAHLHARRQAVAATARGAASGEATTTVTVPQRPQRDVQVEVELETPRRDTARRLADHEGVPETEQLVAVAGVEGAKEQLHDVTLQSVGGRRGVCRLCSKHIQIHTHTRERTRTHARAQVKVTVMRCNSLAAPLLRRHAHYHEAIPQRRHRSHL